MTTILQQLLPLLLLRLRLLLLLLLLLFQTPWCYVASNCSVETIGGSFTRKCVTETIKNHRWDTCTHAEGTDPRGGLSQEVLWPPVLNARHRQKRNYNNTTTTPTTTTSEGVSVLAGEAALMVACSEPGGKISE